MKFTCCREDLVNAISTTARVVPQRHANTALEGILVHAGLSLQLSGYNTETGITMEIPGEIADIGRCVMPSPLFGEIIRRMPEGEDVTVQMDDNYKVTITSGIVRFQIMALDAMDYPELPQVTQAAGLTLKQSQLKKLIEGTIFCTSEDITKPVHMGCLFEICDSSLTLVGLDGFRIGIRKEELEAPGAAASFVVSGAGLKEVLKLLKDNDKLISFQYDDKRIVFNIDGAVVICRLLSGNFLDYRKAIKRYEDIRLCVNTRALESSVERVRLLTTETVKNPMRCTFGSGEVEIKTRTALGSANDICSLAGDGKGLEIGFNCQYLYEALKAVEDSEVMLELQSSVTPMILTPAQTDCDKFLYMVLPVRIS